MPPEPLVIAAAYLVGSVPFAWLVAKRARGIDLRLAGSGNVGAANVLRTTRPLLALTVFLLDFGKGAAAVLVAQRAGGDESMRAAAGVAAVLGHVYPVWLGFRGGKGVSTACGAFSVLAPLATALALTLFVITVWLTRYVSLGSVTATVLAGPLAYALDGDQAVLAAAIPIAILIVFRHRSNLARLYAGTERRIGQRA